MTRQARCWQIACDSHGRDYAENLIRYGLASVGGDVQTPAVNTLTAASW